MWVCVVVCACVRVCFTAAERQLEERRKAREAARQSRGGMQDKLAAVRGLTASVGATSNRLAERDSAASATAEKTMTADLTHTTAAAASDVGNARQARLDKLAAERKAAAEVYRQEKARDRKVGGGRRAPSVPDDPDPEPEKTIPKAASPEKTMTPVAGGAGGEAAQAAQLQKELEEMAHLLSPEEKAELESELHSLRAEASEVDANSQDWADAVAKADAITRTATSEKTMDAGLGGERDFSDDDERDEVSTTSSDDSSDDDERQEIDDRPAPKTEIRQDVNHRGTPRPAGEDDISRGNDDRDDDDDDETPPRDISSSSPLGERDLSSSSEDDEDDTSADDSPPPREVPGTSPEKTMTATAAQNEAKKEVQAQQQSELLSCVAPDMEGDAEGGGARAFLRVEDYEPRSEEERCAFALIFGP
eukprot:COSAG06_NODE_4310_length_4372_cov_6.521179_2_plen_421_part_00